MKTTKHTPGPWTTEYLEQNKLDGNAPARVRAQNRTVAWVDFWQDDSYATKAQMEEQKANARLLAAAPGLLTALEDLEAITSLVSGLMTLHGAVSPEKWHSLAVETEHARSAIALAKGLDQ